MEHDKHTDTQIRLGMRTLRYGEKFSLDTRQRLPKFLLAMDAVSDFRKSLGKAEMNMKLDLRKRCVYCNKIPIEFMAEK